MMPLIEINKSWRERLEKYSVLYVGVILWISQPGMSAGPKCGRPGRTVFNTYEPNGQEFTENEVIRYRCEKDHVILGPSKRQCLRNGSWSGEIPVCSKIAEIERIEYAFEDADLELNKSINRNISSCTEQPQYCGTLLTGYLSSSINITAVRIILPGINDANIDVIIQEDNARERKCAAKWTTSETTSKSAITVTFLCPADTVGNTVHLNCSNQATRICEVTVLLPPVPKCLTPDTPLHGEGLKKVSPNETAYEFHCRPGYKRWGALRVFCQNGIWSPKSPICGEIYCDVPDAPENGYVELDSNGKGTVPYKSVAKYSCKKGYHLNGHSTITCHRWNEWDFPPPKCSLKTPETPAVSNTTLLTETREETNEETCGTFDIETENHGKWEPINGSSSFLVLICLKGFHMKGYPAVIHCLSNGSWSYSSAVCEKSFGIPWGSNWTPSLMLAAAVAAGAGTAIFILCLSVAFVVIKKRRQSRTNTTVFHLVNTHHKNNMTEKNIRRQKHHSATESFDGVIERRLKSVSTNPRKPRSALPNLPLDADPVYAQPFETVAATEKPSIPTASRRDDLYNSHIYAEPVDSRKKTSANTSLNVSARSNLTDSRESLVKTNFGNESSLSVSTNIQKCAKKCAIYDSSDNSRLNSSGNLGSDKKHHRYNEKAALATIPKNVEYLEQL